MHKLLQFFSLFVLFVFRLSEISHCDTEGCVFNVNYYVKRYLCERYGHINDAASDYILSGLLLTLLKNNAARAAFNGHSATAVFAGKKSRSALLPLAVPRGARDKAVPARRFADATRAAPLANRHAQVPGGRRNRECRRCLAHQGRRAGSPANYRCLSEARRAR